LSGVHIQVIYEGTEMTTTITFLGHSAFQIHTAGKTLLIDPFLSGNPLATISAADVHPDFIIVSHGHGDHIGDTVAIAKRTGALVIANYEIATWLQKQGVERTHDMNVGGSCRFDFGVLKLTIAHHSSMLPDGSNGGSPSGLLLKTVDGTIYHACDTALFSDMTLIGDEGLKVAMLPIGDNYTMGPEDAVRAIEFLRPETAIPCHYNTFPAILQDVKVWADMVRSRTSANPVVLAPGLHFSF
jgi:L-ascorbate metabolism protein UlaG (beta-lactamase superfamily)